MSNVKKITLNVIFFATMDVFAGEGTPDVHPRDYFNIFGALKFLTLHAMLDFFLLAHPPHLLLALTCNIGKNILTDYDKTQVHCQASHLTSRFEVLLNSLLQQMV